MALIIPLLEADDTDPIEVHMARFLVPLTAIQAVPLSTLRLRLALASPRHSALSAKSSLSCKLL